MNKLMRSLLILLINILIFFSCTSLVLATSAQPIHFAEAIHLALKTNPRMISNKYKIKAIKASMTQVRGKGLPKLNLELNAMHSNNPLTVFANKLLQGQASFADFGLAQYNGADSINIKPRELDRPGYYHNINMGVAVTIPIFSGGENVAQMQKIGFLLEAAQHGSQQAKTELIYDILQAYEGVLVTSKLVAIAKQSLAAANQYVYLTRDLYKQSIVIQSDVLLAKTYSRTAEMILKSAIVQYNNQLDIFRILIGHPNSHFVPAHEIYLSIPKQIYQDLENNIFLSNNQLLSMRSNINAHHAEINSVKAHNWPQINLQLRHDWNDKTLALSASSNTAMLQMNWALFSSGEQYGAIKQSIAEYKQSMAAFDASADQIRLSVKQAIHEIETADIQFKTSKLNARESVKLVHILKQRYGQGLVTLGQLLDGQSRLDGFKTQQVMAHYNKTLAKARLLAQVNQLHPDDENIKI